MIRTQQSRDHDGEVDREDDEGGGRELGEGEFKTSVELAFAAANGSAGVAVRKRVASSA